MVIVIIEEARAVEAIEEIAAVPGIDVLFIGTNDLAFSLGLRGNTADPKHREAVGRIVAAAKKHNLPVGRPIGSAEQMKAALAEGFTFFQGPADLVMLRAGARPLLDALGKTGFDPKTQPLY